jgi:hypothetical protein
MVVILHLRAKHITKAYKLLRGFANFAQTTEHKEPIVCVKDAR